MQKKLKSIVIGETLTANTPTSPQKKYINN